MTELKEEHNRLLLLLKRRCVFVFVVLAVVLLLLRLFVRPAQLFLPQIEVGVKSLKLFPASLSDSAPSDEGLISRTCAAPSLVLSRLPFFLLPLPKGQKSDPVVL